MDNLDLLTDTNLYDYVKSGLELELTQLCQETGCDKYLSKNNFLKQEYSLTTPFSNYDNLEVFIDVALDVKDTAMSMLKTDNSLNIYHTIEKVQKLIDTASVLRDEFELIENKEQNNDMELAYE